MTLDKARGAIGRIAVYRQEHCAVEQGVITSVNDVESYPEGLRMLADLIEASQ